MARKKSMLEKQYEKAWGVAATVGTRAYVNYGQGGVFDPTDPDSQIVMVAKLEIEELKKKARKGRSFTD